MKGSHDKPPSPTQTRHDPTQPGNRLDSGRLAQLIARHDSALRQRAELLELKHSYKSSHQQATANPTTVDSIEQWNHHTASSAELSNLAAQTLPDLEARIRDLESRARLSLQTMVSEGLPSNIWVGIGAGEYALLEHCHEAPVLRRAPGEAIRRAPEATPPAVIEQYATQIIRSSYRPAMLVSLAAAKVLSVILGLWALIAFFEDLATAQASLHVPVLALASLVLYLGSALKRDLTPSALETVLASEPGLHTGGSNPGTSTSHQEDDGKTADSDNNPGMRWS